MSPPAQAPRNLAALLRPREEPALVQPDGSTWTYGELHARVSRLAGGLAARGLGPGDRVVLLVPLSPQLYQCLLALAWVGATTVLVDPGRRDLPEVLARIGPTGLVGVPRAHLLRLSTPALRGLRLAVSVGGWAPFATSLEALEGPEPPLHDEPGPALMSLTSGTTGRPKIMARSHALLLAQHHALSGHMDLGPADVDLPTLPVFSLHSLASGACCVLPDADLRAPGEVDGARLVAQIRRQGVTTSAASPALFERVVAHLEETDQELTGLRALWLGGARVPAPLLQRLARRLPGCALQVIYGSTEAEPIAFLDARPVLEELVATEHRGALVGRPVDEVALRLEEEEILVAGAHVNPGYLDDPEADARHKLREALPDGGSRTWHRTGDVGHLDAQGRLWLLGRVGEQVAGCWPLPTEARAEQHPAVVRAGLVDLGGTAVLAVQLAPGADLPRTCREVARATGVATVRAVPRVPTDPRHNAKVDRPALVALLAPDPAG